MNGRTAKPSSTEEAAATTLRLDRGGAGRGYPFLLVLLLGMFAVQPWAAHSAVGATLVRLVYATVLLGALFAVRRHRHLTTVGVLLAIPAIILGNVPALDRAGWNTLSDLLALIFILIVAGTLLFDIFLHRAITVRTICGAICVFLLIGLMWALIYNVVEGFLPGSFDGLAPAGSQARESQLFYFSFVTLTTLGYGDITPSRPETMSLATLEAIVGQLYLVVLVAQFVGRTRERAQVAPLLLLTVTTLGCSVAARPATPPLLAAAGLTGMPAERLRIQTLELSSEFAQVIEVTADEIIARTEDENVMRNAMLWKTRGIAAVHEAVIQFDPLVGAIDLWALNLQMSSYFEGGGGSDLFGDQQQLAVTAMRRVESAIESLASAINEDGDASRGRTFVAGWVAQNPIETPHFARSSIAKYVAQVIGEEARKPWYSR